MTGEGQRAERLTADELTTIFEGVAGAEEQEQVRKRLRVRGRTTVNRAYKVVAEFQRQGLNSLNDCSLSFV